MAPKDLKEMNTIKRLFKLQFPSCSLDLEPDFIWNLNVLALKYGSKINSILNVFQIEFKSVLANRWRSDICINTWHLKAYDELVVVENSKWLAEVLLDAQSDKVVIENMHHFMIYFDGAGCFEVIAESWEVVKLDANIKHLNL